MFTNFSRYRGRGPHLFIGIIKPTQLESCQLPARPSPVGSGPGWMILVEVPDRHVSDRKKIDHPDDRGIKSDPYPVG